MSELMWYLNRATGVVLLVLMTAALVLGVLVRRHGRLPGLPRFGVVGLHRSVALLSTLLLAVHVGTAVVDSHVDLGVLDVVVPFLAGYRPLAVGLGTLALDLLVLVVVTSLLRGRLPLRAWRAVHLTTWLMWPLAFAHGLTAGTDLGSGWLLVLALGCAAVTAGAVAVAVRDRQVRVAAPRRAAAAVADASTSLRTGQPVGVFRNG